MIEMINKYSIFINAMIVGIIGWSVRRVISQLDSKVDKNIVEEKFTTVDVKIELNKELIKTNQKAIEQTQSLFLDEIKMLRQELQLKENR